MTTRCWPPTSSTSRTCWSTRSTASRLRALARLHTEEARRGLAGGQAEFNREADKVLNALVEKCWDEEAGAFFDLSGVDEKPLKTVTISSLMPLIMADLPRPIVERLVEDWVRKPEHFWTPYPLPSVPASDPKFMPGNPGRVHLAWAVVDEHQLLPVALAAGARLPGAERASGREEQGVHREVGVQGVLSSLHCRGTGGAGLRVVDADPGLLGSGKIRDSKRGAQQCAPTLFLGMAGQLRSRRLVKGRRRRVLRGWGSS